MYVNTVSNSQREQIISGVESGVDKCVNFHEGLYCDHKCCVFIKLTFHVVESS